jgi:hypothetical protein
MTYYSKRQLEALGEPLGESVTRKEGGRIVYGGGGSGGGAPTNTTTQTSNVPEYARPYVENMLQSTQSQIYTDDGKSFRPYQAYSENPQDYVAGFSPLQQQAQSSAANLQVPGQYGMASGLAGQAGMQAMQAQQQGQALGGEALGYGQAGSSYGAMGADVGRMGVAASGQGFGAGERFAQQATNPAAQQAYMSPYMQNVVDYQKQQAVRDYQMAMPQLKANAARSGAFGGSRQAIQEAEAQRGLMSQLQGIQSTGTQKAFEDAQRQQQFGANLGLQGLQAGYQGLGVGLQGTAQGMQGAQTGIQGVNAATQAGQYGLQGLGLANSAAGTLGQLGTQQLGAQQNIINMQSQAGAQQQAQQQQMINQKIQDYATAQQYPMMQLGMMNAMLRGLPLQSSTTQQYQAQPSTGQQLMGYGLGALGAYKAFG